MLQRPIPATPGVDIDACRFDRLRGVAVELMATGHAFVGVPSRYRSDAETQKMVIDGLPPISTENINDLVSLADREGYPRPCLWDLNTMRFEVWHSDGRVTAHRIFRDGKYPDL
jgi:hypothetical protein